jgi:hypothetical protein
MRNDPQALQLLKILLSGPASGIAPDYAAIKALLSSSDVAWFPTRYETQMDIPPGDYNLEVVLSGEEKFGRARRCTIPPSSAPVASLREFSSAAPR